VLSNFEHLNIAQILRANSLEYFVTIKEKVYPDLVHLFYSNLSCSGNIIHSRVKDVNINLSLEIFAWIFHLTCEGVGIFYFDLNYFEYPDGECHAPLLKIRQSEDETRVGDAYTQGECLMYTSKALYNMKKLQKFIIINHDHCNITYNCPHMITYEYENEMTTDNDIEWVRKTTGIQERAKSTDDRIERNSRLLEKHAISSIPDQ